LGCYLGLWWVIVRREKTSGRYIGFPFEDNPLWLVFNLNGLQAMWQHADILFKKMTRASKTSLEAAVAAGDMEEKAMTRAAWRSSGKKCRG
jgi:fumarate reductase subunit C